MHRFLALLRMTAWKNYRACDSSFLIATFAAAQGNSYSWFRQQRLPWRCESENSEANFFLHRILAEQSSRRKRIHGADIAPRSSLQDSDF